jgi:hypothetical protein
MFTQDSYAKPFPKKIAHSNAPQSRAMLRKVSSASSIASRSDSLSHAPFAPPPAPPSPPIPPAPPIPPVPPAPIAGGMGVPFPGTVGGSSPAQPMTQNDKTKSHFMKPTVIPLRPPVNEPTISNCITVTVAGTVADTDTDTDTDTATVTAIVVWRGTAGRGAGTQRRSACQSARHQPPPIGRERRGEACVASGPKPLRPPLQADPSAGSPCRVPSCPG